MDPRGHGEPSLYSVNVTHHGSLGLNLLVLLLFSRAFIGRETGGLEPGTSVREMQVMGVRLEAEGPPGI